MQIARITMTNIVNRALTKAGRGEVLVGWNVSLTMPASEAFQQQLRSKVCNAKCARYAGCRQATNIIARALLCVCVCVPVCVTKSEINISMGWRLQLPARQDIYLCPNSFRPEEK